ncbi:hypothetical protein FV395_23325 [Salmonella enterica]|nr:hypothetical protein [Salmonella enterica]
MVEDILNRSANGGQYLLGDQQYSTQQMNVNGETLNPTLTPQGLPAVDPQNDNRTAQDWKSQAWQVNRDASPTADNSHRFTSNTGYHYDLEEEGRDAQQSKATWAYAAAFLGGAGAGKAALFASQATNDHINRIHRQRQINDLESMGYNPIDIQRWTETGDNKDLLTNKGKWSYSNGFMVNDLTGERRDAGLSTDQATGYNIDQQKNLETQRHNLAGENIDQQKVNLDAQGTYVAAGNGEMINNRTGSGFYVAGAANQQKMYLDPDHRYEIQLNGQHAPVTSQKSGEVFVKDTKTGEAGWRMGTTQASDAAAYSAQAFLDMSDPDKEDNLLNKTNWGVTGSGGVNSAWRGIKSMTGSDVADTKAALTTFNGAIEGMIEDSLTVENRGQRPSNKQIDAAKKKIGLVDINMSQEAREAVLNRARTFASQSLTRADANRSKNDELTERHAVRSAPQVGEVINGHVFLGGNPNDQRNWKAQ